MARRVFVDPAMVVSPKRHRTHDLMGSSRHSAVFATEQIGIKRYKTPEGFLFCEDVPIARIGEMIYGPGEVPIERAANDNVIRISRDGAALFKMDTLLSFQGKDITNDHPPDDVSPANWRGITVGHIMNPRQGEGEDADVLLADFMIKDPQAIADVLAGKVEVSCGYDAEYHQTEPGKGYQSNIIGNHVALVERGRCGPRCAIGDHQLEEDEDMKTRDNATATSVATETDTAKRIRRTFNDAAEQAIKDLGSTGDGVNVHVHLGSAATADASKPGATADADKPVTQGQLASVIDSIAKLTGAVSKLVKGKAKDADKEDDGKTEDDDEDDDTKKTDDEESEEDKDKEKKTEDSRALETAFKDTISGVEVLSPGLKTPTFDAKTKRAVTVDSLCKMRGRALDRFSMTASGATTLAKLLDGKTYDSVTLDCRDTAKLFKSAVAVQKASNNTQSVGDQAFRVPNVTGAPGMVQAPGLGTYAPRVLTAAEINERNRLHWEGKGVKS